MQNSPCSGDSLNGYITAEGSAGLCHRRRFSVQAGGGLICFYLYPLCVPHGGQIYYTWTDICYWPQKSDELSLYLGGKDFYNRLFQYRAKQRAAAKREGEGIPAGQ